MLRHLVISSALKEECMGLLAVSILCISLIIVVIKTILEKRKLQQQVALFKPLLHAVENIHDITYYGEVSPKMNYLYLSKCIDDVLGANTYEEQMKNPESFFKFLHPDDVHVGYQKVCGLLDYSKLIQVRLRNKNGEYIWFEEHVTPIYKGGKLYALIGVFRNVHEKRMLQQQLEYKAHVDTMSGLYNREFFQVKMKHFDQEENAPVAIIVGDMNNLKSINDQYGHLQGDILIETAANIFNQFSSNQVIVSRIGGDEFTLLVTHYVKFEVDQLIEKIIFEIEQYNATTTFPVNISIGCAYSENSLGKMEQLFFEADQIMYAQKKIIKEAIFV